MKVKLSIAIVLKKGRAEAVHTDQAKAMAGRVKAISDLLPSGPPASKELGRLQKMLVVQARAKNYQAFVQSLERLNSTSALNEVIKKIEPETGPC